MTTKFLPNFELEAQLPVLSEKIESRAPLKKWDLWRDQHCSDEAINFAMWYYKISDSQESVAEKTAKECCRILNQAKIPRLNEDLVKKIIHGGGKENELSMAQRKQVIEWNVRSELEKSSLKLAKPSHHQLFDWDKIQFYEHLAGGLGSSGVFVVNLDDQGILVLKDAKSSAGADIIASLLGHRFQVGFAPNWILPQVKALYRESSEHHCIIKRLLELEQIRNEGTGADISRILRMEKATHMLVMEFVKGVSMCDLPDDNPSVAENVFSASILQDIGKMILYDLFLNNWDRIPIAGIWNNEGNASNLLFQNAKESLSRMVLIDQSVNLIKLPVKKEEYLEHVRLLVENSREQLQLIETEGCKKGSTCMKSVQEFIMRNTAFAHNIQIEGEIQLLSGFVDACMKITQDENGILTENILSDMLNVAWDELGMKQDAVENEKLEIQLNECKDFLNDVLNAIKDGMNVNLST